jgi:rhodanese-related sulfurtransferase
LYDSLRQKLLTLPDETLVYPAHGAGSLCGRDLGADTVSTVGVQRAFNYALAPMSRGRFIELVTADQPDTPAYFAYDAVLNARERPTLERALERGLRPMALARALELVGEGAQLLDTREPAEFAGAHARGAVNVGLGGSFATWCGTILDRDRPVVLIAEPGREVEAATRLGRIGFDTVAERESRAGRIDGAINIPLSRLARERASLPSNWPLVVYCSSGYRSAIASSLLRRAGRRAVTDLIGGIGAWDSTGLGTAPAGS